MLEYYKEEIKAQEKSTRISLSKKYPLVLPLILNSKRFFNALVYFTHPKFSLHKKASLNKWFNLSEHSSPLYRKYNKRELDEGKIENIKIAIKNLDGVTIEPGKIFSFWKYVGKPSKERGFKNGLVLSDGKLKEDTGGGLCQLSNLLAYMFARTECAFVERKHHSRDVFPDSGRTVPFASGATVFYNLIDLKVKNTYSFSIKINLRVTDTQLRGSISSKEGQDYFIKIEERNHNFVRSKKSNLIYRCNELFRVFYKKNTKEKIKEEFLWKNVAKVMYEDNLIKDSIISV